MRKVLCASVAVISGYILLTTITTCLRIYYPSFYMDQWETVASFYSHSAVHKLPQWFFSIHNEHQISFARLLFVLDWSWFNGSNKFLVILILGVQAAFVVLFFFLMRKASVSRWMSLTVAFWTIIYLFSCTQLENLAWGFQIAFVGVYFFSFVSILAFSVYLENRKWWLLIVVYLSAVLSSYSMFNGLMVWFLLIWIALIGRSWKNLGGFIVLLALILWVYFKNRHVTQPSLLDSFDSLGSIVQCVQFGLVFLGNPLGKVNMFYPTVYGAFLVFYFGVLLWLIYIRRKALTPVTNAIVFSIFFILGSASLATIGRFSLGMIQATAERYTTPAVLFSCYLFVLTAILLSRKDVQKGYRIVMWVYLALSAIFTGYLVNRQQSYIFHYSNFNIDKEIALTAIQNDVFDPFYLRKIHPRYEVHVPTIQRLKKDPMFGKIHTFNAPNDLAIATPKDPVAEVTEVVFFETKNLEKSRPAYMIYGGLKVCGGLKAEKKHEGATLYLADTEGNWVGSGRVVNWFPSLWPFKELDRAQAELMFVLHMHESVLENKYQLYLQQGKTLTKIGDLNVDHLLHFNRWEIQPFAEYRGEVSDYHVISHDPAWTNNGAYPGIPKQRQVDHNYGTWNGGFDKTGAMRMSISNPEGCRHICIPYVSGPRFQDVCITMIDNSTGEVIYVARPDPHPDHWGLIHFILPRELHTFDLVIDEDGKEWEQWIGIGPPSLY